MKALLDYMDPPGPASTCWAVIDPATSLGRRALRWYGTDLVPLRSFRLFGTPAFPLLQVAFDRLGPGPQIRAAMACAEVQGWSLAQAMTWALHRHQLFVDALAVVTCSDPEIGRRLVRSRSLKGGDV